MSQSLPMTMTRTIQRAAEETGLSADTLRYYERIGILPGIGRSQSGHRRFTDDDMGWDQARPVPAGDRHAAGGPPPLRRARPLLGEHTVAERLELLEAHKARILSELGELSIALELLDRKISGYATLAATRLSLTPPHHRPAPRRVRPRTAG